MALVWETLSANVYGKLKMVTNSLQFLLWALACSLRLHLLPAPEFESGLMTNRTQLSCAEWLQCPSQEKTTDFSLHSGDTSIHGLSPVPCYGEAQMVHGEAGRVGNPGIWLRATTEVLAHSQCKLIVMVESQGGVDLAIQVRLHQLIHVDQTLTFPLRPLPVLGSEILSIKWSCFSATSKSIATGNTTMSESCVYSPTRSSMYIYLFLTHTCCY